MTFKLPSTVKQGKRFAGLIYGKAGIGKTVTLSTLLKVPNLQVCVLACENNALPGLEQGINIHGITIKPKQLIICNIPSPSYTDAGIFMRNQSDEFYQNIIKNTIAFTGICAVTGEEVKLNSIFNWKPNRIFCFDGLTQFDASCLGRGKQIALSSGEKGNNDPRAAFYAAQDALLGYVFKVTDQTNCHVLFLGHQTVTEKDAQAKHKLDFAVNPGLGTKSITDRFLGRFNNVFYMKKNKLKGSFVLSVAEDDAYTVLRDIDTKKCKELKIELGNLPADLSHEIFTFFSPIPKEQSEF